ncbi:zinc finger protein, putative [Ricinus communis]|uniref:Zinc finger protein, putative n=1 Tax=Ricinus communis TaxID=3988 RepID=B9RZR4_RICCO|nr:zinc finger protein, putative [Ricinus communis]
MNLMLEKLLFVRIISQVPFFYFLLHFCSAQDVPAFYIFGDSLVDVGNNMYLKNTIAKPGFPNGIDFGNPVGVPSGRYTNGRTESGLKSCTPPYLGPTTTGNVILKGVNYASAASGILNETGSVFGNIIPLDMQISNFAKTRQDIILQIGTLAAQKLLNRAIHIVATGSNDVMHVAETKLERPKSYYLDTIISRFRSQLTRLYRLDARKFIVANIGATGCVPNVRDKYPLIFDGCAPSFNKISQAYNRRLKRLLEELHANLTGSKFVLANTYAMTEDIIRNYISYGFENVDEACCHLLGPHGGLVFCFELSHVCQDRTKYVFWDPWHLTETANLIVAKHTMDGGRNYISPMNFRQLLNS